MLHFIVWTLAVVLYTPVLFQLYHGRWDFIDYTHAYFVLPASLLIVWLKRQELLKENRTSHFSTAALALLLSGLLLFVLGWRKDFLFISTFSLIPFLCGLVWFLYGQAVLRLLAFPLAYLIFMVPPPLGILDTITTPLRYGVSKAAVFFLQSFHIPAHREGLLIFLGQQEVFIAPACSGFRSLMTFLTLALLYVYCIPASMKKKTILVLSVIPLALFGNFIRVIILCLISYTLGEDTAQGFFHQFSGFVVFAVIVSGFLILDKCYDNEGYGS